MKKKAGCIISCNNHLLLVCGRMESKWGFPKGSVDSNETYKEAAIRETYEETGIVLKEDMLTRYKNRTGKVVLFHVNLNQLHPLKPQDTNEIKEAKWFHMDDIPKINKDEMNLSLRKFLKIAS